MLNVDNSDSSDGDTTRDKNDWYQRLLQVNKQIFVYIFFRETTEVPNKLFQFIFSGSRANAAT